MNITKIENEKRIGTVEVAPVKLYKVANHRNDVALLSSEAQSQYRTQRLHNLDAIQQKITDGYYFRRDVTEKIASAILKANVL
ncbi:MAG: hypothetical protein AAB071_00690 [Bacteroidota bacterium]